MKNRLFLIALLVLFNCRNQETPKENETTESSKLVVATVNYPLYYFAQRIGGDVIKLEYPISKAVDPAYWVPDEKALEVYQSADIIFANGADYAKWMNTVSLPASRIINTSKTFEKSYIELTDVATHSHGPEGEHEHLGYAFTTWLDFKLAVIQAETVKNALVQKRPDQKELFENNFKVLQKDLRSIDAQLLRLSKDINEQHSIGSHPVYQYLAKAYGLKIQSVHFEPNEMPTTEQWANLDQLLNINPSKIMLWEGQPLAKVEDILNKKGIKVVIFNPCGNTPERGDFIENMTMNIKAFENSLIK